MSYDSFLDNTWKTLFGLGITGAVGGVLFLLGSAVFSNGNVDYCFIERWTYIKEANTGMVKPPMDPGMPHDKEKEEDKVPKKEQTVVIVYELKGHRNWREDRAIGRFDSLEAALENSHKINCSVEGK